MPLARNCALGDGGGMARYCTTVSSPASAEDAFTYLADFSNIADWDPGVSRGELLSGTPGEIGAVYRLQATMPGRTIPLDYRILESVPPNETDAGRVVVVAETADFTSYDVITVTPTDSGCDVTYDADLALRGFRRPFDPLLRLAFAVIGERARRGLVTVMQQESFA